MAIIALFLSFFVSVAPVVADSPTFGAIDANSIELAHTTPNIPEIFIRDYQTAPQLRKLRNGEWSICGGVHSGLFANACGWWPSGSSPGQLFGAVVAITAIAAMFFSFGEIEGITAMSSIILSRSSGNKSSLIKFFGGGVAITGYGFSPKSVWRALMKLQNPELSQLPDNSVEFNPPSRPQISFCYDFPTFRDLKKVSGRDIIRIDFEGVDADEIFQLFEGKKYFPIAFADRVTVLLGCDYEDIKKCYSVQYGDKISKYLKELVPHRPNWVELDPSEVDLIQGPASGLDQAEDDGGSIIAGPKHIIKDVFRGMPTNARGCGVRIYGMEHDKSRARIHVDNSLKRLTIFSHEDNNKGTMGRLVGEGLLMTFWFYNQKGKAATSGPQGLSQIVGRWGDMVRECALASIWRNAHATLGAFTIGALDEGMLLSDERKAKLGHALRCRQDLVERIMLITLPLAISSNLLMLMKNLIRDWRKPTRAFVTAAKEWNTELCHSFSGISCSLSLRKMLGSIDKVLLGKKVWWSEKTREIIICNSVWRELKKLAPKTDIGDIDGDMVFLWKVFDQKRGRMVVLLSRHPIGLGGFVVFELDEVDVPWEFTEWTDKNGVVHPIDPITISYLPTSDEYDWVEVGSDLADADRPADGEINDWDSVFEYEYKKSQAAPGLGKAINAMTLMVMHDKNFKPISTETLADYSQSLAGNVLQMKDLSEKADAIQPKMKDFGQVEKAAVAKFGLNVMNDQGEMVVEVVEGSFTRLINAVVNETKEAHKWLCEQIDFTVNGRNHQVLIDRCLEAGLRPNMEAGKALCGRLGLNAKGSVTDGGAAIARAMKDIDAKPLNEAAAIVLGAYIYMCEKGAYDAGLTYFHAETLSLSEDCLLGYVVRFLEGSDNQPEDDNNPNPEGDGPEGDDDCMLLDEQAAEDATNCGTSEEQSEDEFFWDVKWCNLYQSFSLVPMPHGGLEINTGVNCEHGQALVEKLAGELNSGKKAEWLEDLVSVLSEHQEKLADMLIDEKGGYMDEEGDIVPPGQPWSLIDWLIANSNDDDNNDDNPTPPNGGGDNPSTEKGDDMSEEKEYWEEHRLSSNDSTYEDYSELANRGYERLAEEEDAIKNRIMNLSDKQILVLLKRLMKHEKCFHEECYFELITAEVTFGQIDAIAELARAGWKLKDIEKYIDDDNDGDDNNPTPPNGGGDNPKKEEAQMSKATNAAIAEWAENGKVVQLKQAKNGKYFFVVDGTTKWIPKSLLSEEDSKDLNKVRAVYKSGRDMFNKGVVGTLFKSLGLAALLFAALFGLDAQEGSVAMCASVCFLTQEWDKVWSRVLRSMKHLRGAEMEYDRVVSCGCPEEEIQDKAGMVALYQSQIDKGFEALEEVEHAMDNKELAEVRGSEYQSKQVKAKWPTKCGTQKGHWIATHPECRPNRCNRAYEPNIGRKAPLKVWWQ